MSAITQLQMLRVYAELAFLARSVEILDAEARKTIGAGGEREILMGFQQEIANLLQLAVQCIEHAQAAMLDDTPVPS